MPDDAADTRACRPDATPVVPDRVPPGHSPPDRVPAARALPDLTRFGRTLAATVVLVALSGVPLLAGVQSGRYLNDDAYITLAFAKNLAAGRGFVYNQAPPVLGTTTPLFTLVVAALARLLPHADMVAIAVFVGAVCWAGIAWTIYLFRCAWGLDRWQALVVGLVVVACAEVWFLGMEAYPFAFLLVLGWSLFFARRYLLAGIVCGLLFLTRGEGVLVFGLQVAWLVARGWSERRAAGPGAAQTQDRPAGAGPATVRLAVADVGRPVVRLVAGFALAVVPWMLYAHATFGALLPNTLAAKRAWGRTLFANPIWRRLVLEWVPSWAARYRLGPTPALSLWWPIVGLGLVAAIARRRRWAAFVAWASLYVLGYSLLGVSAHWWYAVPIDFVLQLLFAIGLVEVLGRLAHRVTTRPAAGALAFLGAAVLVSGIARGTVTAATDGAGDVRGPSYTALAAWFDAHVPPEASIAYIEIGYLGYYTDNRIVDLGGLTTPDVLPHLAEGDLAWGFWRHEPDYFVYLPDFDWALGAIRSDPEFDRRYRQVATLPGIGDPDFVIFERIGDTRR